MLFGRLAIVFLTFLAIFSSRFHRLYPAAAAETDQVGIAIFSHSGSYRYIVLSVFHELSIAKTIG